MATAPIDREKKIREQFAAARKLARARSEETGRQVEQGLRRVRAVAGPAGGAFAKLGTQARQERGRGLSELESQIGAKEAGALEALAGEREERRFVAEEAEKQRRFVAGEAGIQRRFTAEQNALSRKLTEDTFNQEMNFRFRELDETIRNDFFSIMFEAKNSGIHSRQDWERLVGAAMELFGGVPSFATQKFRRGGAITPGQGTGPILPAGPIRPPPFS